MDAGRVGARADVRAAYAAAGVDVAAGDRAVGLLRERISAAGAAGVDLLGGLGGFGAALELPPGYARPVLVSATDGVGTKTEIARELGRLDTIGRDLVAMCADDVVCHGARPWLFLDYLAVGRLHPERAADLVSGIAAGCVDAGAALVGGETAEHPGLMEADAFDLAGFCVGIVERDRLIDGSAARVGDRVVGIESSGLHANGYSLVRTTLRSSGTPLDAQLGDRTLGEALLAPTTIYAAHVLAVIEVLEADGLRLGGVAHVTGGGLAGNLPRAVAHDLGIHVRVGRLARTAGHRLHRGSRGSRWGRMRATFNAGVGMALVVEPAAVTRGHRYPGRPGPRRVGHRVGRAGPDAGPMRYRRGGRDERRGAHRGRGVGAGEQSARTARGRNAGGCWAAPSPRCSQTGSVPLSTGPSTRGISVLLVPPSGHPDRASWDMGLAAGLQHAEADVVVLAGFLRILGPNTVAAFRGRIVNVHPSLLPAFPGMHAIEDALRHVSRSPA